MGLFDRFRHQAPAAKTSPAPTPAEPPQPVGSVAVAHLRCPYCGVPFEKAPTRKRKCPACKGTVYVKYTPTDPQKRIVTEARAQEIEALWAARQTENRIEVFFNTYDLDGSTRTKIESALRERLRREPTAQEVIEAGAEAALGRARATKDWHQQKMLHFERALWLFQAGRPHLEEARQSRRAELRGIASEGLTTRVRVLGGECAECAKLDGRVFTIEEALASLPIPCRACETWDEGRGGWCRCLYQADLEGWLPK